MDPATIAVLINTLGPIIIPLVANGVTWLFKQSLGLLSSDHQAIVTPFLPVFAGIVGTTLGLTAGNGALPGLVGGLAATGLHQAVTQPVKAVEKIEDAPKKK